MRPESDRSQRFLIIESLGAAPQQSGGPQRNTTLLTASVKLDAFVREGEAQSRDRQGAEESN